MVAFIFPLDRGDVLKRSSFMFDVGEAREEGMGGHWEMAAVPR